MSSKTYIEVYGAREHNLKDIDVKIPHDSLSVITGLSGSGKSSLAFDTIYAEGQRRYIETLSAYARNFLGHIERPEVDEIKGLSPVIAIEQKNTNRNAQSTVGTITEIYDFLRLLYARTGEAFSYLSGKKMVKYTEEQILELIFDRYTEKKILLLAPMVRSRKGHYRELFEQIRKKGYLHVRVDGELRDTLQHIQIDRYKNHDIEVVIDRILIKEESKTRLQASVKLALEQGGGMLAILDAETQELSYFSKNLMCPETGIAYQEPAPHDFSFNSPKGYCPNCKGSGEVQKVDLNKILPDREKTIFEGGIAPLGKYKNTAVFTQVEAICKQYDCSLNTPIEQFPEELVDKIIYGTEEPIVAQTSAIGVKQFSMDYKGISAYIEVQQDDEDASATAKRWADKFSKSVVCPACKGTRLKKEALYFRIQEKNIVELADMDIAQLHAWFHKIEEKLNKRQQKIGIEIIKEIRTRLQFLLDVGLHYLSLSRRSASLSGGESQRIRLATQIGSQLVNVLYILDEPSIGLHPADNERLIRSLKQLRDIGNTVIVVEHDKEMMLAADYVLDLGPHAGRNGGEVVFEGTPKEMMQTATLTASYISGTKKIERSSGIREGNGESISLTGARGNNLKNVDVEFPLGKFICVTGVSGSGKSSLINATLAPILSKHFYRALKEPLPYDNIEGLGLIDKVIAVDQSPIGRTPRSNPATYTGVFTDIRKLFSELPESKIRGYKNGRFSFNVKGGRCENCGGNGYKKLEMGFMADVYVACDVCNGKRYNRETLEVKFKGQSIADVLNMTINQAVEFFDKIPSIVQKIKALQEVGLGYIKLGQSSTTLSGGENQRVKLATELAKHDTGKTLYLLDEPTTGLHFEDINCLLEVLDKLVDRGNTLIVVEHNTDVIEHADHLIDMGPEGGKHGGHIVCTGTPEEVAKMGKGKSLTADFLFV